MTERIQKLTELVLEGKMRPEVQPVEYDREDLFLPHDARSAKRLYEYITAQKPVLTPMSAMTGLLIFDSSVEGDFMSTKGLPNTKIMMDHFYKAPLHNLSTCEWQHSTADFAHLLDRGMTGVMEDIAVSRQKHQGDAEAVSFLDALKTVAEAMLAWAAKCSREAAALAETVENEAYRLNLLTLSGTLKKIPAQPAKTFYEAVLTIYLLFSFCPDSLGNLDRNLRKFYERDLAEGTLTRDKAKEYLQELYLMLQAKTKHGTGNFTRGGESHFSVGGYLPNGEDGFDDLSLLILEAMTELPTYIPQISLRWTKKLPFETYLAVMRLERADKHKRIAFVNDEIKLKGFTDYFGIPFETACGYCSVGCNEVAFPGGFQAGTTNANALRCIENTFFARAEEVAKAETFDEFFAICRQEICRDLDEILDYDNKLNLMRAEDTSYVTALLFDDCVKNAKSFSRGGVETAVCIPLLTGIPNVIDSIAIVKQFVYDEKRVTMPQLLDTLHRNWEGHEALLLQIKKKGHFFGNDDETSNFAANLYLDTVHDHLKDKRNVFGYRVGIGNLIGYVPHHRKFGEATRATPDGRKDGELMKFGIGQSGGYDREGLSALLASIAKCDRGCVMTTSSVTNVMVDQHLVMDDANHEKLTRMLETYFRMGGSHYQLNYVSREELLAARAIPEEHKSLRVRVSGFADYFVKLKPSLQDDIIARTSHRG